MRPVDLIIMNGYNGTSDVEEMVNGARRAMTRDLVDKAVASNAFSSIIISTNDRQLVELLPSAPSGTQIVIEPDPGDVAFHFGKCLQALISKHDIERVVYLGGGSAPLLPVATLTEMAERVREADALFLANNFYSVDFCAFTPASALLSFDALPNDNGLGWLLGKEGGLPSCELPRTVNTIFDVDTPIDLAVLSLYPELPQHIEAYLAELSLDTRHIERAIKVFVSRQVEVLISGRVSSQVIAYLGHETACRARVFSEERGMRSSGRLAQQQVYSLLGMHMQCVGIERFFAEELPLLAQAAFIDDRVLWAHFRMWPSSNDRFNSDLMRPQEIIDPFVRRFTDAAMSCPVPVVLGGHSLVAGGLYVLIDAAWALSETDLERTVKWEQ
jgi:CTP:molybdopterin cytidylyltransferase MocA